MAMGNEIKVENDQVESIEQFLIDITETDEYKVVEYLAFSIRKRMLHYLSNTRLKSFEIPAFLLPLAECIAHRFCKSDISADNMLDYMESNDKSGWVMYYDMAFIRTPDKSGQTVQCDRSLFFLILTGYILDSFCDESVDIRKIIAREQFAYTTNQYGLTVVSEVKFKRDSFIFDNKAYLYNLLTNTSVIGFMDGMPGFAKIITEEVRNGDILLRLDERLALTAEQEILYSTLDFQKFRGPQFHFEDAGFKKVKTVIVHIDPESCDKLLMVIKKDYDSINDKHFMHVEIETLPYCVDKKSDSPCITTFLHGMYYPEGDFFTHIDYTKNQYLFSDYEKKYLDVSSDVPIDFYSEKQLHYKIWCIENGKYSREVWYKLMVVSLPERYRVLLDEILA